MCVCVCVCVFACVLVSSYIFKKRVAGKLGKLL